MRILAAFAVLGRQVFGFPVLRPMLANRDIHNHLFANRRPGLYQFIDDRMRLIKDMEKPLRSGLKIQRNALVPLLKTVLPSGVIAGLAVNKYAQL